jgi:hypothetical protein
MPLVILQYLYSLQIKGDSQKKRQMLPVTHRHTKAITGASWQAADRLLDAFIVLKMQCSAIRKSVDNAK